MAQKRPDRPGRTARWYDKYGRQRSKSGFNTAKAAQAYEEERKAEVRKGIDFDPHAGKVLFRNVAAAWLAGRTENVANHRSILATAQSRRGNMKTLGVDAVFGGLPLNSIAREDIQEWVNKLAAEGKKPSTVRHNFWTVRMVLEQAVIDGKLSKNPADYVNPPKERGANGGKAGVVARAQFLTVPQIGALVAATPWPYNVLVHVAPCSGLRAAELGGLQIQDVELPPNSHGWLRVERTARFNGQEATQDGGTKTESSQRSVPLDTYTTDLLRDYLGEHPHGPDSDDYNPAAPLWPAMALVRPRPSGVRGKPIEPSSTQALTPAETAKARARQQAVALAELSVKDAEARLILDWGSPLRHATFYKAVYRPAVLRANAASKAKSNAAALLPEGLRFHSLRHTYASLQAKIGTPVRQVAEWMGHSNPITTETIYTHLYRKAEHAEEMDAFGAMMSPELPANVIPLWG